MELTPTAAGTTPAATGAPAPVAAYAPAGAPGAPGAAAAAPGEQPAPDPYAPQIELWKRQHKTVTEITISGAAGEVVRCFIHNPDRNVIAYALTCTMNKKLLEAGEWILNNCFLGGDPRCNPGSEQQDDALVIAAAMEAAGTIELLAASSKKL
jgi:hypothetical protein